MKKWIVTTGRPDSPVTVEIEARALDLHNKLDYVFYGEENAKVASFPRQHVVSALCVLESSTTGKE